MAINLSVCLSGVSFRGQIRHEICSNWFHLATSIPPVSDAIHPRLPRFQKMKSIFSQHCLEQQIHKQNPPATTDKAGRVAEPCITMFSVFDQVKVMALEMTSLPLHSIGCRICRTAFTCWFILHPCTTLSHFQNIPSF